MNDDIASTDDPTGPIQQVESAGRSGEQDPRTPSRTSVGEVPEIDVPEPQGRVDFSEVPGLDSAEDASSAEAPDDDWRPAQRPQSGGATGEKAEPAPAPKPVQVSSWFERPPRPPAPPLEEHGEHEAPAAGPAEETSAGFWVTAAKEPSTGSRSREADSTDETARLATDPAGQVVAGAGKQAGQLPSWEAAEPADPVEEDSTGGFRADAFTGPSEGRGGAATKEVAAGSSGVAAAESWGAAGSSAEPSGGRWDEAADKSVGSPPWDAAEPSTEPAGDRWDGAAEEPAASFGVTAESPAWGAADEPVAGSAREETAKPAAGPWSAEEPQPDKPRKAPAQEPGDVRVAPLPADPPQQSRSERPGWEGSLFDGPGEEGGVPGYAPVEMPGASTPPKPGKPSSGNWEMPEWIREEERRAREGLGTGADVGFDEGGGRGRRIALLAGVLAVVLVGAGGYFFWQRSGDSSAASVTPSTPPSGAQSSPIPSIATEPQVELPPNKAMPRFSGRPTRAVGMVNDRRAGLAYPRLASPWRVASERNGLATDGGWSGQQAVPGEGRGAQARPARLLTGVLQSPLAAEYTGPSSLRKVTAKAMQDVLDLYYDFPHQDRALASQALRVGEHRGWLISSYLKFRREGVKATGEVVAVAVIDTGRDAPAVVLASAPNTHRKLWPDINTFLGKLKPVGKAAE